MMGVCYIKGKKKKDTQSTSDFFSVFLPVAITLTEKIISWKGSSDACFV